jgi:hypothetical protein
MRAVFSIAIFCAIAIVAFADETANLDETTDLLQERAMVDAGAKTQVKVGAKAAVAAQVKAKAGAHAKATVMIGTHELDAAQVEMAKHALSKVTMKLGARHPVFLGEAAGIADFTSNNAKYVKGGYDKLKTILKKVDDFENELALEKQSAVDEREKQYKFCDVTVTEQFNSDQEQREKDRDERKIRQTNTFRYINQLHIKISKELSEEGSYAKNIRGDIQSVDTEYKNYWAKTEERHQVRNVLMQALWLVCTGFATFRHTTYCTNIRQQPDFDEPSAPPPIVEELTSGAAQAELATIRAHSATFGTTMQPVWEQQKVADSNAVNELDGDVDMEKGFVNNRAPWGVDPEGMDSRGGAGEELGESNEAGVHDMTNEEMSSRLTFLVEGNSVPERISVPINAFIQALSTDDTAVQGGLVEALVKMDTEEGKAQSDMDYAWYNMMVSKRDSMYTSLIEAQGLKAHGLNDFQNIERQHAKMKKEQEDELEAHDKFVADTKVNAGQTLVCDEKIIELEALIEVCNEELTNIQRLNSLLRYLVVGDEAVCKTENGFVCNEGEGSCTWRNRGAGKTADTNTDCETETGQDIPCDYTGSQHEENPDFPTNGEGSKFCACEYGFFGLGGDDKKCNAKSCPGFGRIRYPENGQMALTFENKPLMPTQVTGGFAVTEYKPLAVCSGKRLEEHGTCDTTEGKCVSCWLRPGGEEGTVTPELERKDGLVQVPATVVEPMPFSGEKLKCEEWFVPQSRVSEGIYRYTTEADPNLCNGRGTVIKNFMGYVEGTCECKTEYYGTSCELFKCQMHSDTGPWYKKASPIACNGRGTCQDEVDGTCSCENMATGKYCENKRCAGYDAAVETGTVTDPECGKGVGVCNFAAGRCQCATGASCGINGQALCPGACIYADCQANCQAQSTDGGDQVGLCDRFSGLCMCNPEEVYNGPACETPGRGVKMQGQVQTMVWTGTFDKWGWSTCKDGYLMVGMKTDQKGTKDALYNIDQGICQRPFEAHTAITRAVESYRCYHENWWKKFDSRGGKFCRRNYFVAGLFRSHCNSLYCIEMAKCCSVKRSLWTNCKWVTTRDWTSNPNGMMVSGEQGFIVGFFRDKLHTLSGITSLRQCTPIWYGQLFKYKTRFDN